MRKQEAPVGEEQESEAQRKLREAAAELLATPDPEPVSAERFQRELERRLSEVEADANELLARHADGEPRHAPPLRPSALSKLIGEALVAQAPEFGFGFGELARVYPVARQDDVQDFSELVPPVVPFALAVRLGSTLAVRVGISFSRKVSPGTTWDDLKPWRVTVKPDTRRRKLTAWLAEAEELPVEAPVEVIRTWLVEARERDADAAAARAGMGAIDPPSEKQLAFVRSLIDQKGLDEAGVSALLLEHGGVRELEHLERSHASPLIEALLALPRPARQRKPAATKPKRSAAKAEKLIWSGTVLAARPRIKSVQIGGQAKHNYPGFVLLVEGTLGGSEQRFAVGLGKAAQAKHGFRVGDRASGAGVRVDDPTKHACDLHKVSKLVREAGPEPSADTPPYGGAPESLEVYRAAGHRPLGDGALGEPPCDTCVWACRMPTDAGKGVFTIQEVCYGPADCSAYAPF